MIDQGYIRQEIASRCLAALLASQSNNHTRLADLADTAVMAADALLAALGAQRPADPAGEEVDLGALCAAADRTGELPRVAVEEGD